MMVIKLFLASMAFLMVLLSTGCGETKPSFEPAASPMASAAPHLPTKSHAACQPVRAVVFVDKSSSMNGNQIKPLEAAELDRLIELVSRCEGYLAFGVIGTSSNKGLLRITVPPAPISPVEPQVRGNVWADSSRKALEDYQAAVNDHQQRTQVRNQAIAAEVSMFRSQAKEILEDKSPQATDIYGAVKRLDLFLGEPDGLFEGATVKRYGILVTDGENTVRRKREPFQAKGNIYVVNGTPNAADLSSLKPIFFESARAAIDEVIATAKGGS
jgi:hypothetical protein